jgi:hypothetical protein
MTTTKVDLDHGITEEMRPWVHLARERKETWIKTVGTQPKTCDMNPLVFPEIKGKIVAVVVAPLLDRDMGLQAALICRRCMDPDAITMVMDAHIRHVDAKQGDKFLETYRHGDMQRACDHEGACETGLISDCLICHRIEKSGRLALANLPYKYRTNADGSHGPEFEWTPSMNNVMDTATDGNKLEGNIPHALRQIMAMEPVLQSIPELSKIADSMELSDERRKYHVARAALRLLAGYGFFCVDMIPQPEDEESTDAERPQEDQRVG